MSILTALHFSKSRVQKNIGGLILINPLMKHYPDNPHTKYEQWVWCKDEFVPPLKIEEFALYIKNPERFRLDFLKSLKLYLKFCLELAEVLPKIKKLAKDKQLIVLVTVLFLFQSAMDHHYYYYDYYLDLEEYPKSPLGWHYLQIKRILTRISEEISVIDKEEWISNHQLDLLSKKGKETVRKLKSFLDRKEYGNLMEPFQAMQIYQIVQQEEEKLFSGNNFDSPVFTTGLALWTTLGKTVQEMDSSHFRNKKELVKILDGDPIYGTRKILTELDTLLIPSTVKEVRKEVRLWS